MTPVYFNSCFGWLHSAKGTRGVVLCSAFGVEELITNRFLRVMADQIAAAGMPALRFDYRGTGDSADVNVDGGGIGHWLDSIKDAINWMRDEVGVSDVVLVGFRLGALMATEVSVHIGSVSKLVLVGTITSGRRYVRELKALATFSAKSTGKVTDENLNSQDLLDIEVTGFKLTQDIQEALCKIDLLALKKKPAEWVLILGGGDSLTDSRLATRLSELGCIVELQVLPGYAQLEWHAIWAKLPSDAFAGLIGWLGESKLSRDLGEHQNLAQVLCTDTWKESPVHFGPAQLLFGIYCRAQDAKKNKAVIFANDGPNRHIGSARMYVSLARRLGAQGVASLRMDIAGVGDSPSHSGQPENQLYYRGSQRDVSAAIEWIYGQGYSSCTVVGHCAGAYLAFYAAVRDKRATGLVMVNLQKFFWGRSDSLELFMSRGEFRSNDWYLSMLRDPKTFIRLWRGEINVSGIISTIYKRIRSRCSGLVSNLRGRLLGHESDSHKVVRWFRELSQRGTKVMLVYSAQDPGLDELELYCGRKARRILGLDGISMHTISGADHSLTQEKAVNEYANLLESFL